MVTRLSKVKQPEGHKEMAPVREDDSVSGVYTTNGENDLLVITPEEMKQYQDILNEDETSFMKNFDLKVNNDEEDDISTISGNRIFDGLHLHSHNAGETDSCASPGPIPAVPSDPSSSTVKASHRNPNTGDGRENVSHSTESTKDISNDVQQATKDTSDVSFSDIFPVVASSLKPISTFDASPVGTRTSLSPSAQRMVNNDLENGDIFNKPSKVFAVGDDDSQGSERKNRFSLTFIIATLAVVVLVAICVIVGALVSANKSNKHGKASSLSAEDATPNPYSLATRIPGKIFSNTTDSTLDSTFAPIDQGKMVMQPHQKNLNLPKPCIPLLHRCLGCTNKYHLFHISIPTFAHTEVTATESPTTSPTAAFISPVAGLPNISNIVRSTSSPTSKPTMIVTLSATASPVTLIPTASPTDSPSLLPTPVPTEWPSPLPTPSTPIPT
jgi:hypothetical protein